MSIANNSLLRRILVEVRDGEAPEGMLPAERDEREGRLLELRRTRQIHAPPFATSLHFWAHALRAFLERLGRPELFEALAAHCLCEAAPGDRVAASYQELSAGFSPAGAPEAEPRFLRGFRMIDEDVLVSWVAECDDQFVALFLARLDWVESAEPLDLE
jgi:hypothetical protein